MRVAYVCLDPGVPVFGRKGSSVHCQEMMRALRQRGFDVLLFASKLGQDVPQDLQDIPRYELRCDLSQHAHRREKQLMHRNRQIQQQLNEVGPLDLIYERYALWSFSAMQFAHDRLIPGILEVNSPLIDEQKTYRTLIDEPTAKSIRDRCFRFASSIIAVSEQVKRKLNENDFARLKTTTVPNGVNCQRFRPVRGDEPKRRRPRKTVIGFVGTLKPWHGVAKLLNAFSILHSQNPEVILRIVGDGPQRESLRDQLLNYSTDVQQSVEWLGAVPNSQIPSVLSTFDIAVAPYPDLKDFYFSPLKILEYMAAGLPVVAGRIGQIPYLIDDGVCGLLVNPGCPLDLARRLFQLCEDPDLRSRLGKAAVQHVEKNHTWQCVAHRILATVPSVHTPTHCEIC